MDISDTGILAAIVTLATVLAKLLESAWNQRFGKNNGNGGHLSRKQIEELGEVIGKQIAKNISEHTDKCMCKLTDGVVEDGKKRASDMTRKSDEMTKDFTRAIAELGQTLTSTSTRQTQDIISAMERKAKADEDNHRALTHCLQGMKNSIAEQKGQMATLIGEVKALR